MAPRTSPGLRQITEGVGALDAGCSRRSRTHVATARPRDAGAQPCRRQWQAVVCDWGRAGTVGQGNSLGEQVVTVVALFLPIRAEHREKPDITPAVKRHQRPTTSGGLVERYAGSSFRC